jgi:hypothetical protein
MERTARSRGSGLLPCRASRWQRRSAAPVVAMMLLATLAIRPEQRRFETSAQALACSRTALGAAALAGVSKLEVAFAVAPTSTNEAGQRSSTTLELGLPDSFTRTDRLPLPGRDDLVLSRGFDREHDFSGPTSKDAQGGGPDEGSYRRNRLEFARWALILLIRETPLIPIVWSAQPAVDGERLRLEGTGADGFNLALLLDTTTCQPVAAEWTRAANFGDGTAGLPATQGNHVERVDLLDYDSFDGVRLPGLLRLSTDGVARFDWKVISVKVNATTSADPIGATAYLGRTIEN